MNNHYKQVVSYFAAKAAKYDLVDKQLYWSLSDQLLKKIVIKKIVTPFADNKKIDVMDAGAGTGRWSVVLHELFKKKGIKTRFDLIDITPSMLKVAREKINRKGIAKDIKIHIDNIEDLSSYKNNSYDIVISFYNVLSFVEKPGKALQEIYKKLKNNGLYASIVSNKYHSYFFNIITNNGSQLEYINKQSRVRFNKEMPYIHCFTPREITTLYENAGFKNIEVIGFPNFIYPNMEETQIEGQSNYLRCILKNRKTFNKVLGIEFKECFNSDVSARGNTLLAIGKK